MPNFYNTSSPTPSTSNSINSVSIDIRDFLLQKNISSTYPQISTTINGSPHVGQPVLDTESKFLNQFSHQQMTQDTSTLDVLGSILNGQGIGFNTNGSVEPNFDIRSSLAGRILGATGLLNDTKIGTIGAQQLALALANNAAFNVEQEILGTLNTQDNILSLIKTGNLSGFRPSYKITIPSSSSGRVADFAGKILGFTIPRSYLGDEGSIFQDENGDSENIKRANSMIENTGKGQVMALIKNSIANLNASDSTFRSGYAPGYTNNKGEVQITNSKLYAFSNDNQNFEKLLAISDGVIPDLNYNREEKVNNSDFFDPISSAGYLNNSSYENRLVSDIPFSWTSKPMSNLVNANGQYDESQLLGDKKSILVKTQKLFNSTGMKNIVTVKGDMNKSSSQISQANGKGFSKGNAVLQRGLFDGNGRYKGESNLSADETYCRSWTTLDRYDKVRKLVRSGTDSIEDGGEEANGIYSNKVPYRDTNGGTEGTILEKYGFPKITPYSNDSAADPKRFMFSLENLAWSDNTEDLPEYEKGSGDVLTGKRGRIMWFPPYDINFTENSAVNWESTNFIGRGEPIYTYNNSERSGTLSFKIVVDHPSYINAFRGANGPDDSYVNSFWAGCVTPEFADKLTVSETSKIAVENVSIPQKVNIVEELKPDVKLVVYFPNDQAALPPDNYEDGTSGSTPTSYIDYNVNPEGNGFGIKLYPADGPGYTPGLHQQTGWFDNTNYGLNGFSPNYSSPINFEASIYNGWKDRETLLANIDKYLNEKCPHCVVKVTGFASQQGIGSSNNKLLDDRADSVIAELKKHLFKTLTAEQKNARFKKINGFVPTNTGCRVGVESDIEKLYCKKDRRAEITFEFDRTLAEKELKKPDLIEKVNKKLTTRITDRFYNETKYFEQLTDEDPLVFDRFRDKIKYFHPAFHSTTPEGLNSRLTFLLQCTKQGPTSEKRGPNNLAFGRAPVCILRIGDFYNTKIIIDSLGIDYEPLVWDLNPEGIGVQPMIANVNITFKFIGGSALMGPINKLQNALSFNYFANTQVYDVRADYITKDANTGKKDSKGKELTNYVLHNGMPNIPNASVEIIPENLQSAPEENQVMTQDNALIGVQEQDLTTSSNGDIINDKMVIDLIKMVSVNTYSYINNQLLINFRFNTNNDVKKFNLDSSKGKSYKGQIYIRESGTNNILNLGYVTVRSNGNIGGVVFETSTGNNVVIGPDLSSEVQWICEFELEDEQNEEIMRLSITNSATISVEWETGSKSNIVFTLVK